VSAILLSLGVLAGAALFAGAGYGLGWSRCNHQWNEMFRRIRQRPFERAEEDEP
jgi:hypothetical protein